MEVSSKAWETSARHEEGGEPEALKNTQKAIFVGPPGPKGPEGWFSEGKRGDG